MITRPATFNPFEFVVLSALRAQQLLGGCVARLDGDHAAATMAQMEVAKGLVTHLEAREVIPAAQCRWQL